MFRNEEVSRGQVEKVSVIIPAYNVEKYIDQCLKSVCNQTYSNLEIIIVYDASDDKTLSLCRAWQNNDSRVKLLINHKRKGLGAARNKGLKCAGGKYVTYLDSDDWYAPDFVECLLNAIEKTKAEFVSYAGIYWVTDEQVERKFSIPAGSYETETERATVLLRDSPAVWKKIYNRQWLIANNLFQPEIYHYEDWGYNIPLILCASKIIFLSKAGVYYRLNREGCLSNDKSVQIIKDFKKSIEFGIGEVKKRGLLNGYREQILIYFYNNYLIRKYQAIFEKNDEAVRLLECLRKEVVENTLGFKECGKIHKPLVFGSFSCRWIVQNTGIYSENMQYYGFSSLISAMTVSETVEVLHANDFRKNQVMKDIEGQFFQEISNISSSTYLFLDFLEEKNNIIQVRDNLFLTESEAYKGIKNRCRKEEKHIMFFSDEFILLWKQQCSNLVDLLLEKKAWIKVILIKNRLSLKYGDLNRTKKFAEQSEIIEFNNMIAEFENIFLCFCKKKGIQVLEINLPDKYVFTDQNFKYGCNAEYMNEVVYAYMGHELFKKLNEGMG